MHVAAVSRPCWAVVQGLHRDYTLSRRALQAFFSMAVCTRLGLVTSRSSPTTYSQQPCSQTARSARQPSITEILLVLAISDLHPLHLNCCMSQDSNSECDTLPQEVDRPQRNPQ